jgi:hypothetical protein
MEQSVQWSGQQ